MFKGTALLDTQPDSLAFNRAGDRLFVKLLPADRDEYQVVRFMVGEGKLGEHKLLFDSVILNRAYLAAHPQLDECLVTTAFQNDEGEVHDAVWRVVGGQLQAVKYDSAANLPPAKPHDTYFPLKPIYSWDGEHVIVPLSHHGLCVVTGQTGESTYVAYPEFEGETTGQQVGVVPNQLLVDEERPEVRLVYVSRWEVRGNHEYCQVHLLDLDSCRWVTSVELDWIVYQVAGQKLLDEPWLARGSRPPQTNVEHARLPRYARIDPGSGLQDFLEFWGEPYWETALEPHGRYIVYMDQQRHGLVRLNPATGEMDIDRSWYDQDAQLFVTADDGPVYAWKRNVLLAADWREQAKFEGYEDE